MEGRLLSDLKVADLRRELEKRSKDKSGVKQVLVDRLREVLEEEGLDPQNYRFGGDSEIMEQMSINEDDADVDKSPSGKGGEGQNHTDAPFEEPPEQKKLNEESVPFVVQVGDQEEDLDYDLKADNSEHGAAVSKSTEDVKSEANNDEPEAESGKGTKAETEARNLWVSNLPRTVKAADLKQHFSKAGKVLSATVVMSTRSPGGCFGFVEMASVEDAANAVKKFDGSDFNGTKVTVEATERKSPTLASKSTERATAKRDKGSPPKAKPKFPMRRRGRYMRPRSFAAAMRRRTRRFERPTRLPLQPSRVAAPPVRPYRTLRPVPNLLAYQSLRRARILAASRYALPRGIQQVMDRSVIRSRIPRAPPVLPRSAPRYSTEQWSSGTRYSMPERRESRPIARLEPIRRSDPRLLSGSERRRVAEPPRVESRSRPPPRPPLRRSEPSMRRVSPPSRPRMPPPMSPFDHKRPIQTSMRSFESPRYEKSSRDFENSRTFNRPSDPPRSRPDPRSFDRVDVGRSTRGLSNGGRYPTPPSGSFTPPGARYKAQYGMQTPQSGPRTPPSHPGSRESLSQPRRDYRGMSRSPPRSRDAALLRPYPGSSPQHRGRISRERSPLHPSNASGPRPKVVDYGHRSEPRLDWPSWRDNGPSIQTPSGHTWKPAGQSMVSNYGSRGSGRRYP